MALHTLLSVSVIWCNIEALKILRFIMIMKCLKKVKPLTCKICPDYTPDEQKVTVACGSMYIRPKTSVSLIVGCSTETTSGSTRPPIIETEVWGPLSVRHCTEQMVRFDRTAMNEICNEIFTLYILITAAIIITIKR